MTGAVGYLVGAGANLSGATLAPFNFSFSNNVNLAGTNFSGAFFEDSGAPSFSTSLAFCNLTGANFAGANLGRVEGLQPVRAIFTGANLTNATFSGAAVRFVDFSLATVSGANFSNTNLAAADFMSGTGSPSNITATVFENTRCPDGESAYTTCPGIFPCPPTTCFGHGW